MLGYSPRCIFHPQGDTTASQALGKSYRQALALGGLQSLLVQGLRPQKSAVSPWMCHQEVVKAAKGVLQRQRCQVSKILALPAQLKAGKCPPELQSRAAPPFPCASPQTLHLLLQGAGASPPSELSPGSVPWGGRPGKATRKGTEHKAPLRTSSLLQSSQLLAGADEPPPAGLAWL